MSGEYIPETWTLTPAYIFMHIAYYEQAHVIHFIGIVIAQRSAHLN